MRIIGGVVAYEDGIKTVAGDQFSPTRKVRVELNFSLDDADDENVSILSVLNTAQSFVQGKLGIEAPTAAAAKTTRRKAADPTVGEQHNTAVADVAAASKATAAVISDKDKLAAAAGLTGEKAKPAADPAAIEDTNDSLDDILGTPAKPVTDAELNAAVQAKNKAIKNPVAIKEVLGKFNGGPGKVLADIPQEKRAEFLAELGALKAS